MSRHVISSHFAAALFVSTLTAGCDAEPFAIHDREATEFATSAAIRHSNLAVVGVLRGGLMSSRHILAEYVRQGLEMPGSGIEVAINVETGNTSGSVNFNRLLDLIIRYEHAAIEFGQIVVPYTALIDATIFYPYVPPGSTEPPVLATHDMPITVSSQVRIGTVPSDIRNAREFREWLEDHLDLTFFPQIHGFFYRLDENGIPVQVFP